jgi:hypothetical protein
MNARIRVLGGRVYVMTVAQKENIKTSVSAPR